MPILNIYGSPDMVRQIQDETDRIKDLAATALYVDEWPIDGTHISLRFFPVSGSLIGDIEIEIIAHSFEERISKKDEICSLIRSELESGWALKVRVWLHLVEMGYGLAQGDV